MSNPADHTPNAASGALTSPEQTTNAAHGSPAAEHEVDIVESIAHAAPIVLPIVGGVLMFLLAFIAVFMA